MSNLALATAPYLRRITLLSVGLGIASVALGSAATPVAETAVELAPPAIHEEPRTASRTDTVADDAAPIAPGEPTTYATIEVGGETYVKLARIDPEAVDVELELEEGALAMPKHGKLRGFALGAASGDAIATVAARDAGAYAAWQGKQLVVGADCRAKVTGFAVVATLEGDPFAIGTWDGEGEPPPLTAKDVFRHGDRMLVATLSASCTGRFARDARAPRAAALTPLTATASQVAAARAALVASEVGRQLNDAWAESGSKLAWDRDPELMFTTTLHRHAVTDKMFVSIHATMPFQCGGLDANIWGLYQIEGDVLVPVVERGLEGISEILELVDIDGDGTPDVIGKGALGLGTEIQRADGTVEDAIDIGYAGCPC